MEAIVGTAVWSASVRYAECDQQGVVFNAHYLLYCDEALAAFCDSRGLTGLAADVQLVASSLTWTAPARHGDVIAVRVGCPRVGSTSFGLDFDIRASGRPCCQVQTTYVRVDSDGRAVPITADVRAGLTAAACGEPSPARP